MELLGHLKVIVPLGINLVEFDRTKKNQQDGVFKRKLSPPKKQKMYRKYFPDNKNVRVCSLWKESTTEIDLREACAMVFDSNPASDLFLTSHAI